METYDVLLQRNEALTKQVNDLQTQLKSRENNDRMVEIINVVPGQVCLRDPENPDKDFILTGYGEHGHRRIVPEHWFIAWKSQGILAIQLCQIRIERYVTPPNETIPKELVVKALTEDEICDVLALPLKQFKASIAEIGELESWKRIRDIGEGVYEEIHSGAKDSDKRNFNSLLVNLEYLGELIQKTAIEINEITQNAEDIISFSAADKIRQRLESGKFAKN